MKRKLLSVLLMCVLVIGLTGCGKNNTTTNTQIKNIEEKDNTISNQNDSIEQQNENNNQSTNDAFYVGTYYMVLTDGSLAEDGTGTIILNNDMSCTYIYGQSNMGCTSYSINDHVITLKVSEQSSDIVLVLEADHKFLIDANNEKYMKE